MIKIEEETKRHFLKMAGTEMLLLVKRQMRIVVDKILTDLQVIGSLYRYKLYILNKKVKEIVLDGL